MEQAAEVGLSALALTDHDSVAGTVRFTLAANACGIRPILGAEITLHDNHHLLLLAKDSAGWGNLCNLITQAQHTSPKGEAKLPSGVLEQHASGLIALSGCRKGAIPAALLRGDRKTALKTAKHYTELFGHENFWIELHNHKLRNDQQLLRQLVLMAKQLGVGYVATNNVHYAHADGYGLQDVLVAIKGKTTYEGARELRRISHECYLKSGSVMAKQFCDFPLAIINTQVIAQQCQFELKPGIQELPMYPVPEGMTPIQYVRHLCLQAIPERYPEASPEDLAQLEKQLEHELHIIQLTHSEDYFLLVWDICRFARTAGIRYQGRGSGAGSITAYLLYISPVDALRHSVIVFERFLSLERNTAGDFDIDFESNRREEVIQYIFGKYTLDHAAMASTVITFRRRSALRDIGKVFGLPLDAIPQLREDVEEGEHEADSSEQPHAHSSPSERGLTWKYLTDYAAAIHGFPRHLGQHNGGFILTKHPIHNYVPTEPATMENRYVVQWDKDALSDLGWVKVDILGLRILDVISETLRLVEETTGQQVDIENLRYDDANVFRMIEMADTVGVFLLDSRAQSQNLPFMRPRDFLGLAAAISLIRPGPIQAGTVRHYFRRLLGQEPIEYPHPSLEAVLRPSLGTILWQDQVALVAHTLTGLTLGEGEQMRRSLGKSYAVEANQRWEARFLAGAIERGVEETIARAVFEQLKAFAGYAFPFAHAAAFATLVYKSAFLKCYFPVQYGVALLNNMQVGFWSPSVVTNDLKRRKIDVLPVSINASQVKCSVEGGKVRIGLAYVARLGETGAAKVVEARGGRRFSDLADFYHRTQLPESHIENLILCGAMNEWKRPHRDLLWELGTVVEQARTNPLGLVFDDESAKFGPMSRMERLHAENFVLGLSTGEHGMALYREWLNDKGVITSQQLRRCKGGERVRIAGINIVLQRPPTAKGTAFLTLQDEYFEFMDVIINKPIFEAHRQMTTTKLLLAVEGVVQRSGIVINVVAERIYDLQERVNAQT